MIGKKAKTQFGPNGERYVLGPDGKYVEVDETGAPVIKKTATKRRRGDPDFSSDCGDSADGGRRKSPKRVKKYDADGNVYYAYPTPSPSRRDGHNDCYSDGASVDSKGNQILRDKDGRRLPTLPPGTEYKINPDGTYSVVKTKKPQQNPA